MENVVMLYDHLEYFSVVWCNLPIAVWYFLCLVWYIFPVLVCLDEEKSGNPAPLRDERQLVEMKKRKFFERKFLDNFFLFLFFWRKINICLYGEAFKQKTIF
jgi:hypothetical protein